MFRTLLFTFIILITTPIFALPIDWHGALGFDTTIIDNYRRLESQSYAGNSDGTQEVPLSSGGNTNANFQSYIFKLQPNIIINDSATIKAELSSGYGRGGFSGDNSVLSKGAGTSNQLYPYSFSSGDNALIINQLYTELYADTATYIIGRHPQHFGLGAIVNDGSDIWDRFFYLRDGLTIKIKLGNVKIAPYWTRVGRGDSLSKGTRIKDYGVSFIYDSVERDLAFGILYNKKESTANNSDYTTSVDPDASTVDLTTTRNLGKSDVKLTDLYVRKGFGQLTLGLEVPIFSGEIGNLFGPEITKYKAKAYILEANYKASDNWSFDLKAGMVSGDDAQDNTFDAMYLNPNYQIANLLFRYNLNAVADTDQENLYDSYINNATYIKLGASYLSEKWEWNLAAIWAKANEVAKAGSNAYNHAKNETFVANYNQKDDLGLELDAGFKYNWNSEISVEGSFGHLFAGKYFGYTNTATENAVDNSYILQLKTSITF